MTEEVSASQPLLIFEVTKAGIIKALRKRKEFSKRIRLQVLYCEADSNHVK